MKTREDFEKVYGQVWDTSELIDDFEVVSFCAPLVSVVRRKDNTKGSMQFNHQPRFYFDFQEVK